MAMQPEHRQTGLRRPSPTQGKLEQLGIRGLADHGSDASQR